jgi:hypothetical protein
MARIGVSITKSVPFRNSVQEFSNVYFYDSVGALPTQAEAISLIDSIVAEEKTWHSTAVTFVRGRLWSQTGDKATSEMIDQHNLSGTGARSTVAGMDKERAYLFRIRAGSDSRGNPVYLRKWYHSCGQFATGIPPSTAVLENTSGFAQADRDTMAGIMSTIGATGGGAEAWKLCSKNGRFPTAGANFQAHQYLEHHQMGDMWRAQ